MKPRHSLFAQWLAMSLLFGLTMFILYQQDVVDYRYKATEPFVLDTTSLHPAGEITAEFLLSQPVHLTGTDLLRRDLNRPVCFGLLMANYMNRRNRGQFQVSLRMDGRVQSTIQQAREIKDNTKLYVCFNEFTLDDLLRKPAMLEIKGIDGRPGRSVTTWLTPTNSSDQQAMLGGQPTNQQLVFSIHVRVDALPYKLNAYILMLLTAMLMAALIVAARWSGRSLPHPST